jgi:hypothetical protein
MAEVPGAVRCYCEQRRSALLPYVRSASVTLTKQGMHLRSEIVRLWHCVTKDSVGNNDNNTVRNITMHRTTKHIAMNVECLLVPRRFVNGYQYFGATYWFHLQGRSSDLKMEAICPSETFVSTLTVISTRKNSTDSFTALSSSDSYNNAQWRRKPVYNINQTYTQGLSVVWVVWPGPQTRRLSKCLFYKNLKFYKTLKNLMTPGSWPCCQMGKVTLLPIFPLSFASYLYDINTILLPTVENFKFLSTSLYFHCCFKLSSVTVNASLPICSTETFVMTFCSACSVSYI